MSTERSTDQSKYPRPDIVPVQPFWLNGEPAEPLKVGPYPSGDPYNGWLILTTGDLGPGYHGQRSAFDQSCWFGPEAAVALRDYLTSWIDSWQEQP